MEVGEVLPVLVVEEVGAFEGVGAGEFVGGAVEVAQLEVALAEPQVQEGVADRAGAAHRQREVVPAGRAVTWI